MNNRKTIRILITMVLLITGLFFAPASRTYAEEEDNASASAENVSESSRDIMPVQQIDTGAYFAPQQGSQSESAAETAVPSGAQEKENGPAETLSTSAGQKNSETEDSGSEENPLESADSPSSANNTENTDHPGNNAPGNNNPENNSPGNKNSDLSSDSVPGALSEEPEDNFSFSVSDDGKGNDITPFNDFISDNGDHYLFLPASVNIGHVTLHYTGGGIISANRGNLDSENNTITVDFSDDNSIQMMSALQQKILLYCMQSSLPAVSVSLNGTDLEKLHRNKDVKYKGNTVTIYDPSNDSYCLTADNVEMKGRGNSSWTEYEKKGYQIKFSSRTSVLGMDKAKKWILLANSSDPSLMRTSVVYDIAAKMNLGFVPDERYVDLWINGDYRGVYLIGEKVELDKNRLNLTDEHAIIAERDDANFAEEDHWLTDSKGKHYTLKDSNTDEDVETLEIFLNKINSLNALLNAGDTRWSDICSIIDAEAFAEFYLANEFFSNDEVLMTSYFMYMDGPNDKIHPGPLWDFDSCMGIQGFPNDIYYVYRDYLFKALFEYPEFYDLLVDLYNNKYKALFASATDNVNYYKNIISGSAEMNYIRWALGDTTDSKGTYSHPEYISNVDEIQTWLKGRSEKFSIDRIRETCIKVSSSSDLKTYTAYFNDGSWYYSGRFAVWSSENGQDDVVWYTPVRCDNTGMYVKIPILQHNALGTYTIHLYLRRNREQGEKAIVRYFKVYDLPARSYVYEDIDYTSVFDPSYYLEQNPDVKNAYGNSVSSALSHFVKWGMAEGRKSSLNFDLSSYKKAHPDLRAAYGTDNAAYYLHYIKWGARERRVTKGVSVRVGKITVFNGQDYRLVYDYDYYSSNADIRSAFGDDDIAALANFVRWGMPSGRHGNETFDVRSYAYANPDVRNLCGKDLSGYYLHYIRYGYKEHRECKNVSEMRGFAVSQYGTNYSTVYDYNFYVRKYADLEKTFGFDDKAVLNHFVIYGMREQRQAISSFDEKSYRYQYPDLRAAYRNQYRLYYLHYINYGCKEKRQGTGTTSLQKPVTVFSGSNYKGRYKNDTFSFDLSSVYDYDYYTTQNPSLLSSIGDDDIGMIEYFATKGLSSWQNGKASFDSGTYANIRKNIWEYTIVRVKATPVVGIAWGYDRAGINWYTGSISRSGGASAMLGQVTNYSQACSALNGVDALCLTGGSDVTPSLYGEAKTYSYGSNYARDISDMYLIQAAYDMNIPVLGICRGLQIMNVAFDNASSGVIYGTLYQDLNIQGASTFNHMGNASVTAKRHIANLRSGSLTAQSYGTTSLSVTSAHHEGIKQLDAFHYRASGWVSEGGTIIEAIEAYDRKFFVGVQWHPECLGNSGDAESLRLWKSFITAARSR